MTAGEKSRVQDRRERLYEVIFGYETPAGRGFDLALLVVILVSVVAVVLESVSSVPARFGTALRALEWIVSSVAIVGGG